MDKVKDIIRELDIYISKLNKKVCVTGTVTYLSVTETYAYFTLEDECHDNIRVYIGGNTLNKLQFSLKEDQKVTVQGTVSLYVAISQLQITAAMINLIRDVPSFQLPRINLSKDTHEQSTPVSKTYNTKRQSMIITIIHWLSVLAFIYLLYKLFS